MISEEEWSTLSEVHKRLTEKQSQLLSHMNDKKRLYSEMDEVRKCILLVRCELAEEEKSMKKEQMKLFCRKKEMLEKAQHAADIEKVKQAFSFANLKLTKEKKKRKSARADLEKASLRIDELATEVNDVASYEHRLDVDISAIEPTIALLSFLQSVSKRMTPLLLKVADLESELASYSRVFESRSRAFSSRAIAESMSAEVCAKQRELGEVDDAARSNKIMLDTTHRLLESRTRELRETEEAVSVASSDEERARMIGDDAVAEMTTAKSAMTVFREAQLSKLTEMEKEDARHRRDIEETLRVELAKKQKLVVELDRKLENTRVMIATESTDTNDWFIDKAKSVFDLRYEELGRMTDRYAGMKRKIETMRKLLDDKISVIEDLKRAFPMGGPAKVAPGMDEFLFVYEIVFIQNRNMAGDLPEIMAELKAAEEINAQLKSVITGGVM